jgi:type VI secretion system secreted protein VgrG
LRYPGQYFLAETGLSQNYFRDYDPAVGRYVESDPIGLNGGSWSTYAYVNGNPIGATDPEGSQIVLPVTPVAPPPAVPGSAPGTPPLGQVVINILQDVANASADMVGSAADAVGEAAARQSEYLQAKNFCDSPPPPGSNDCATLSRQIDHAKQCISLYQSWDSRWSPGRHATKLQDWTNRLNQLKAEHKSKCTNKCP